MSLAGVGGGQDVLPRNSRSHRGKEIPISLPSRGRRPPAALWFQAPSSPGDGHLHLPWPSVSRSWATVSQALLSCHFQSQPVHRTHPSPRASGQLIETVAAQAGHGVCSDPVLPAKGGQMQFKGEVQGSPQ